jgi:hypothetical protein
MVLTYWIYYRLPWNQGLLPQTWRRIVERARLNYFGALHDTGE